MVDLHRGPVSARPGVRANAFSVLGRQAYSIDPRVNGRAEIGERFSVSAGVGRYSQARPVTDRDSVDLIDQTSGVGGGNAFLPPVFSRFDPEIEFAPQDTELTVRQAIQASAGGDVEIGRGIGLGITGYFRDQDNAEPLVFDGRTVSFATRSRNVGLEVLLRKRLTNKLYGWIAYTLSYGELRFVQGSDAVRGQRRPSDFDQRHNLVLLASYALPPRVAHRRPLPLRHRVPVHADHRVDSRSAAASCRSRAIATATDSRRFTSSTSGSTSAGDCSGSR